MKQLLAALLLAPAILLAQDNPNYDPDYNGDGCFSITDVLGLLPLFGSCVDADTIWACGDSTFFDNYWYATTLIGEQCWFAENLRTQHYANGDSIPAGLTDSEWTSTISGATAVYGEGSSACDSYSPDIDACNEVQSLAEYGRLYNWYAVDDARGLCPNGWHAPSHSELLDLVSFVQSQGFDVGTALKTVDGWRDNESTIIGTDNFGFSAVPGGYRHYLSGAFLAGGWNTNFWSPTSVQNNGYFHYLSYNSPNHFWFSNSWTMGYSIRCLLDTPLQGCTDSSYIEFNPSAELDDGSCLTLVTPGCTDSLYLEFDPLANVDDGSCLTLASTEWACGDSALFDNYWYATTLIGDQCWFAENLRTTQYVNGDSIAAGLTDGEWSTTTSGATAVYGEGISTCNNNSPDIDACDEAQSLAEYGRLYNWYAVDDARGLCPSGWHVPTDGEWYELENYISSQGFSETVGVVLKSSTGYCCDGSGTDLFEFSSLPGGKRHAWLDIYALAGSVGCFWTSTITGGYSWYVLIGTSPNVHHQSNSRKDGFSIRCLKDSN